MLSLITLIGISTLIIILTSSIAGLAVIILLLVLILKKKQKKKYLQQEQKVQQEINKSTDQLTPLFGNNDNIKQITNRGSRTTVEVKDIAKIDEDKIKSTFEEVMFMGNKIIFVIGEKSATFAKMLEDKINHK